MEQIIAHLVGDYVLQSHWMAINKIKNISVAIIHAFFYTIPFIIFVRNPYALLIIFLTHALIDRYRIASFVTKIKNWNFEGNGYPTDTPVWLSTWLTIILDNTLHLIINYLSILYFK